MARPKRDELALIERADQLRATEEQKLAFTAPFLTQVMLPLRNPGDVRFWERRNGPVLMTMTPGYTSDPKTGKTVSRGLPSGAFPRQLLPLIFSEALRTESRELDLGRGVVDFFRQMRPGMRATGGANGSLTRLYDAADRLLNCAMTVEIQTTGPNGEQAVLTKNMQVAHHVLLWGDGGSREGYVQLSTDFFNEIMESAVPLDLGALQFFGDDAWCIDLYAWLNYEFYRRRAEPGPITHTWDDLNNQFGSARRFETKEARYRFRKALETKLRRVKMVYQDANVETTAAGIVLRSSKTHVPLREFRKNGQLTLE